MLGIITDRPIQQRRKEEEEEEEAVIRHDGTQAKAKERTHTGKEEEEEEASHSTTPQLTSLPPSLIPLGGEGAAVAAAILLCRVGPSVRLGAREPMSQKRSFPLSSFLCHHRLFQKEVRGEGDHTKQNSLFCSCSSYSSSLSLSSHRPSPPPLFASYRPASGGMGEGGFWK